MPLEIKSSPRAIASPVILTEVGGANDREILPKGKVPGLEVGREVLFNPASIVAQKEAARAALRRAIGTRRLTGFLTLIRLDGRWQVISKVFHHEEED